MPIAWGLFILVWIAQELIRGLTVHWGNLIWLAYATILSWPVIKAWMRGPRLGRNRLAMNETLCVTVLGEGEARWSRMNGETLELSPGEAFAAWLNVLRSAGLPVVASLPGPYSLLLDPSKPVSLRRYPWAAPPLRPEVEGAFPDRPAARSPLLMGVVFMVGIGLLAAAFFVAVGPEERGVWWVLAAVLAGIAMLCLSTVYLVNKRFDNRRMVRVAWDPLRGIWELHRASGEVERWDPTGPPPRFLREAFKSLSWLGVDAKLTSEPEAWSYLADDVGWHIRAAHRVVMAPEHA